jgi:hypothetical protein
MMLTLDGILYLQLSGDIDTLHLNDVMNLASSRLCFMALRNERILACREELGESRLWMAAL